MVRAMADVPDGPLPAAFERFADSGPLVGVWVNEAGGWTARQRERFIKWNPRGSGESLLAEAERMRWLASRHPCPEVLEYLADESGEWLVTRAVAGESAVSDRWRAEPATAVRAIATGLRRLHGLPTADCPFEWSVAGRLAAVREPGGVLTPEAVGMLANCPSIDRLVICHGDPCSPNTLIDADGGFAANVDLGRLGLADRWADLAVASMSLGWNYGDGWEDLFFTTYGVVRDEERIDYYRRLWDAT